MRSLLLNALLTSALLLSVTPVAADEWVRPTIENRVGFGSSYKPSETIRVSFTVMGPDGKPLPFEGEYWKAGVSVNYADPAVYAKEHGGASTSLPGFFAELVAQTGGDWTYEMEAPGMPREYIFQIGVYCGHQWLGCANSDIAGMHTSIPFIVRACEGSACGSSTPGTISDLRLEKVTVSPDADVKTGEKFAVTLTVRNTSPGAVNNVMLGAISTGNEAGFGGYRGTSFQAGETKDVVFPFVATSAPNDLLLVKESPFTFTLSVSKGAFSKEGDIVFPLTTIVNVTQGEGKTAKTIIGPLPRELTSDDGAPIIRRIWAEKSPQCATHLKETKNCVTFNIWADVRTPKGFLPTAKDGINVTIYEWVQDAKDYLLPTDLTLKRYNNMAELFYTQETFLGSVPEENAGYVVRAVQEGKTAYLETEIRFDMNDRLLSEQRARICKRVTINFADKPALLVRINQRLWRAFGFDCSAWGE